MAQRSRCLGRAALARPDDGFGPQPRQDDEPACSSRSVTRKNSVVVGMTSNGFTLADPNDRGMMDVVGFDTSAPAVIADFVRNS